MMAALCEDGTYGLNCGRKSDRISVLHVKLTETAFKALENYQNCKVSSGNLNSFMARERERTCSPKKTLDYVLFLSKHL